MPALHILAAVFRDSGEKRWGVRISVFWAALALVAGLVLGAWGPRMDLRKARDEMAKLRSQAAAAEKRTTELQTVRTMLRLPEGEKQGRRPRKDPTAAATGADTGAPADAGAGAAAPPPAAPAFEPVTNHQHRDALIGDKASIRQASELWKTRSAVARNSFLSNTGMSGEEEKMFDVLVEAMNLRLEDRISQWSGYLKSKTEITPEDGIRLINDLSSVMVLTYDEFDRRLPQGWREKAGENFQLFDFIDPEVAMPLTEIENPGGLRPRGGGRNSGPRENTGAGSAR